MKKNNRLTLATVIAGSTLFAMLQTPGAIAASGSTTIQKLHRYQSRTMPAGEVSGALIHR